MSNNPWLSFRQYEEKDAQRFKGRDTDIKNLFHLVEGADISVLYAESGIGKSSLVKAGLVPNLRGNMYLPIPFVLAEEQLKEGTPRAAFENNIRAQILSVIATLNKELPEGARYLLIDDYPEIQSEVFKQSLWWFLRSHRVTNLGFEVVPVILFDQFEEIFKLPVENTEAFFELLHELSIPHIPEPLITEIQNSGMELESIPSQSFKFLFSLREEYIGQLDYWGIQRFNVPALKNNRYSLQPLTYNQAKEIITQQGVDTLDQVADMIIDQSKEKGGNHISTLILSVLCSKLYDMAQTDIDGHKIPYSKKDMPSSTTAIIGQYYNEILQDLHISKRIRKVIESSLVSADGERLRIPLTDPQLKKIYFEEDYLEALDKKHLIKTTEINNVKYVELVHDKVAEVVAISNRKVEASRSRRRSLQVAIFAALIIIFSSVSLHMRDLIFLEYPFIVVNGAEHPLLCGDWTYLELDDTYEIIEQKKGIRKPSLIVLKDCPNLQKVVIKNCDGTETDIPIFINCENLREIVLPEGIKTIHPLNSIIDCPKLEKINIPSSVTLLGLCNPSVRFCVSPDNSFFKDIDGIIWRELSQKNWEIFKINKDLVYEEESVNHRVCYTPFPEGFSEKEVFFNNTFFKNSRLEENQFVISEDRTILEKVRCVPDSVLNFSVAPLNKITKIASFAVNGRQDVKEVHLYGNVNQIGYKSFANCSNLKKVVFNDGISIGDYSFFNCSSLDTLCLTKVSKIGVNAFSGNPGIKYIELPDSVEIKESIVPSTGRLLRCDISFSPESIYKDRNGVIFNSKSNIPIASRTDFHTYCDSLYYSVGGALIQADNDQSKYRIIDIPTNADVTKLNSYLKEHSTYTFVADGLTFYSEVVLSTIDNEIVEKCTGSFDFTHLSSCAHWIHPRFASINAPFQAYLSEESFKSLKELYLFSNNPVYCLQWIPKQYRAQITVVVPNNLMLYSILNSKIIQDYRALKTTSSLSFIIPVYKHHYITGLPFIAENNYVFYPLFGLLFVFITIILIYKAKRSPQAVRDVLYGILVFSLSVLVWFAIYWTTYYWFDSSPKFDSILLANLVSVPIALAIFITGISQLLSWRDLARRVKKWFKYDLPGLWRRLRHQFSNLPAWIKSLLLLVLLVIGLILFLIHEANLKKKERSAQLNYAKELLKEGSKDEAARTLFELLPKDGQINQRDTVGLQARLMFQQTLNSLMDADYPYHFTYFDSYPSKGYYMGRNSRRDVYSVLDGTTFQHLFSSTHRIESNDGKLFIFSPSGDPGMTEIRNRDSVLVAEFWSSKYNEMQINPVSGMLLNRISAHQIEIRDSGFSVVDTLRNDLVENRYQFNTSGSLLKRKVSETSVEIRDAFLNVLDTLNASSYYDVDFRGNYICTKDGNQYTFFDEKTDSLTMFCGRILVCSSNGKFFLTRLNKEAPYDYEIRDAELSVLDTLRSYDTVFIDPQEKHLICYKKPNVEIRDENLAVIKVLQSDDTPESDGLFVKVSESTDNGIRRVNVYDANYRLIKTIPAKKKVQVSEKGNFFVVEGGKDEILNSRLQRIGTSPYARLYNDCLYDRTDDVLLFLSPTKEQWEIIRQCYYQYQDKKQ